MYRFILRGAWRLSSPCRRSRTAAALAAGVLLLCGCTTAPTASPEDVPSAAPSDWQVVHLPGKKPTHYQWEHKAGRRALAARSEASASMLRRKIERSPTALRQVSFSWWVQDLVANGSVADVDREDAPARVMFGFAGDVAKLPFRTRAMFELAEVLTGERPPYATLMYVWDAQAPVGTVIINPRSDRVRKIVVDSGPSELRRWREHRRDLAADFRLAFGEEPGTLTSIAVMTDSDNTRSSASSWYGPVDVD